jgi:hypothetical protein
MTTLLDRPASKLWTPLPFGAQTELVETQVNAQGYHTEGDILYVTNDGIDINALWAEALSVLDVWNQGRDRLVGLMSFQVTREIETIPQVGEATFELASEFGEPEGERLKIGYFNLGFDFRDYDRATRFTWKALRDMDARQVRAVNDALLQADRRLIFKQVMSAIFDNRERETNIRGNPYKVYSLYNGDAVEPPTYLGRRFPAPHDHYMVSGNELIDSNDLEEAYENIAEHGYSVDNGTQIVCLMNRNDIKETRRFRMDKENNNGVIANYDFIPSRNQPAQLLETPMGLIGSLPPDVWNGLRVYGSYGDILLIEEPFMPDKYFLMFGTGGVENLQNLVGIREHANAQYRGLKIIPGRDQRYPLIESYYTRGFGTGIRQRGGGVVMQIGEGDEYEIPEMFVRDNGIFTA